MNERYINVLKRLYQANKFKNRKVDLFSLEKACSLFNDPHKKLKYIHVAGTNGKGSVCKKLSSILISSGYKTGLFISPHISTFRERIQINDNLIEKEYVTEELEKIYDILNRNNLELTFFEYVTLLCFNYFRDKKIDIGVMEVGLGGVLDATNVIDPLLSIITSIGFDHMDSLGYTLEEIAGNKAGIIKRNIPSLIGSDCYPKEVFENKAKEMNSILYEVKKINHNNYPLNKDFETENNLIVTTSTNILKESYPQLFKKITKENIDFGIKQMQPCRMENVFEIIGKEKLSNILNIDLTNIKTIFLDVGHNGHALEKVCSNIKSTFTKRNLRILCGFSSSKDKNEIFDIIFKYADKVHLMAANHPRSSKYDDLIEELQIWKINKYIDPSLIADDNFAKGNIKKVIYNSLGESANSQNEEIILICGSFFLMKEVRKVLGYIDEEDPFELNEIHITKFNK